MSGSAENGDMAESLLTIDGELSFGTTADVHRRLLSGLEAAEARLVVDLSQVTSFDLAGVQLLYAAHRSAAERGIALEIRYGANAERFAKLFRFAGLKPIGGGTGA